MIKTIVVKHIKILTIVLEPSLKEKIYHVARNGEINKGKPTKVDP